MEIKDMLYAGEQCVQEEPVFCTNACPVHVDVRAMMDKVQEGNFTGAFKLYQKQVLFPGIISRICDQPCRQACVRKELDDPLSVRLIEKACVDYAGTKEVGRFASRSKNGRVTVIGGGLSGLSCALNLSQKGYKVKIYEQSHRLGGRLWDLRPEVLPPEIIAQDFAPLLDNENIEVVLHKKAAQLDPADSDVYFVATGTGGDTFDLIREGNGKLSYDFISLESSRKGMFVGGSLIARGAYSPVHSIAQGLRVAGSIERFLKNASLTLDRENEGGRETKLQTGAPDREKKPAVLPSALEKGYSREEAVEEAGRCFLCQCKLCVKPCTLLESYREYPKKYISNIQQTMHGFEMVAGRFINSCNLCGLCKEVCPTDLDMGEICLSSRRILHRKGKLPPAFHDFWLRDMQFSLSEKAFLSFNPPGAKSSSYAFFPGCQLGASNPKYVTKAYSYLCSRLPEGVGLTLGCCGAPAEWSGREEIHQDVLRKIRISWEEMGSPTIILACSSCQKMFKRYLPEIKTATLWNVIKECGLPEETAKGKGATIAVFDPCASRYDAETQENVRALLKEAGYQTAELDYHGRYSQCCGYGGLIYSANPAMAKEIVRKRTSASSYNYVTYCANCRDIFSSEGKPAWHILDLLFGNESENDARRKAPTLSQRRENRIFLKEMLSKEIGGVSARIEKEEYEKVELLVPAELQKRMDKDLIHLDHVKKVIHHAQTTGNRLYDSKSKHFIAYLQDGIITYWVEYAPRPDFCEVINVYCHRMQIEGGGK